MPRTIISDTSCLIVLTNINELELLQKIYGQVITTNEVATEYGQSLPDWIVIKAATDAYHQKILEMQMDKGEASAIALALEIPDSTIILDDYKARRIAELLGLRITGTVGVIIRAKLNGIISSVKPLFDKIRKTDFRLTEEIENQALKEAGE
jgi:predicted nucleic acid-binding protein